jgi:endonuclease/exonuclease/phosphatase family metal-dependent hydrolase
MTLSLPRLPSLRAERRPIPLLRWFGAPPKPPVQPGTAFRAVTWNLFNGGLNGPTHQDTARFEEQIQILAELRPDVLALQECTWWHEDNQRLLKQLADVLDMTVVRMEPSEIGDGMNHTSLLHRRSVLTLVEDRSMGKGIYAHALIRATLRPVGVPDDSCDVMVFTTHLNPWSGDSRLAEAKRITDFGGAFPGAPSRSILLGDLNTPDRRLWPWQWRRIPRNLWSRYRLLKPSGRWGGVDRRAVQILLRSGWTDPQRLTRRRRKATVGYYYPTEPMPWSLDYALVHGHGLDVSAYWTADSPKARRASDHLPVVLEVVVNPSPPRADGLLPATRTPRQHPALPPTGDPVADSLPFSHLPSVGDSSRRHSVAPQPQRTPEA